MPYNFKSITRQLKRGNLKKEVKIGYDGKYLIIILRRHRMGKYIPY